MKTAFVVVFASGGVRTAVSPIPIQRTPIYRSLSLEVQIGTPLRTLRMEPDFHTSDIYLAHPEVCQPFVECITGIESIDQPERADGAWGLVDGVQALVLGEGEWAFSNPTTPVRYVSRPGRRSSRTECREISGILGREQLGLCRLAFSSIVVL